ncbi:MAG: selenocysteine lyase [Marinilabiliales bacterium]|nr:MAG: selenocysteine lyase [Marinilabiliales bacterium]
MSTLENWFQKFRENTIGFDKECETPYCNKKIIYGDWIASGRLYKPLEDTMSDIVGPFVANTHTESNTTGTMMTNAYHEAKKIIKDHVNAAHDDVLLTPGFGMTAAVVKLQRILGLKTCGKLSGDICLDEAERPVVFITHMEHHSNHTSWYETIADVEIVKPNEHLRVDLDDLKAKLEKHKNRKLKIGSFTACSNVTGVHTPYREMAKLMHEYGGYCFIDFAAVAPYEDIDMHPEEDGAHLDAIFFSPHKFLGGPGASGVLIFNSKLYHRKSPDQPGGGTVEWTNPWGEYMYFSDIEAREDGGTPGFLQCMRTALAIKIKDEMGVDNIFKREKELLEIAFEKLEKIENIRILADEFRDRLSVISFYIEGVHYNLVVKLLNDLYGVQVRGGCACAGTYGHYLLDVSLEKSHEITKKITSGDLSEKPGWIRFSMHPTTTNDELKYALDAIEDIAKNFAEYAKDYEYSNKTNEFYHKTYKGTTKEFLKKIFN